eukprot:3457351-Heterocapsa_arctica.AAC.1
MPGLAVEWIPTGRYSVPLWPAWCRAIGLRWAVPVAGLLLRTPCRCCPRGRHWLRGQGALPRRPLARCAHEEPVQLSRKELRVPCFAPTEAMRIPMISEPKNTNNIITSAGKTEKAIRIHGDEICFPEGVAHHSSLG